MKLLISTLACALLATGCASSLSEPEVFVVAPRHATLLEKNSVAASALAKFLHSEGLSKKPLLVSTLARVNDVESSSTFGRALTEHLSSRLATLGISVIEPRVRKTLAINGGGEFVLSRDAEDLQSKTAAKVILAGTYSHGRELVTVHLKLIDASTQVVLMGHSYVVTTKEFESISPL